MNECLETTVLNCNMLFRRYNSVEILFLVLVCITSWAQARAPTQGIDDEAMEELSDYVTEKYPDLDENDTKKAGQLFWQDPKIRSLLRTAPRLMQILRVLTRQLVPRRPSRPMSFAAKGA